MSPHRLWRGLPHGFRRGLFDRAALVLGRAAAGPAARRSDGPVVVAGALRSPTGLGEAARLVALGLQAAGRDVRGLDLTTLLKQPAVVDFSLPSPQPGPGALIVVLNPPVASYALWLAGRRIVAGKRRIGHFVWEYERMPPGWAAHADLFDAIAAPSRFCQGVFAQALGRAVTHLPYPAVLAATPGTTPRPADGRFRVVFVGDLIATSGRKNPLACVEAVARAFPGDLNVSLSLILGGGAVGHPVRKAVEGRAAALGLRLTVDDRMLDAVAHAERLAGCDVYLSLHRAEGFGLTIIEAMLEGRPVVATGAPPLDEYLTNETGFPVAWRVSPAPDLIDMAAPGSWAEPDIDQAAAALRLIRAEPGEAARRAAAGREALRRELGAEAFARRASALLD